MMESATINSIPMISYVLQHMLSYSLSTLQLSFLEKDLQLRRSPLHAFTASLPS